MRAIYAIAMGALLAAASCTPAATKSGKNPSDVKVPAAPNDQPLPPAAEAVSYSALAPDANAFVHIDGPRLRSSAVFAAYRQVARLIEENPLAEAQKLCGFDPIEVVIEASFGARLANEDGAGAPGEQGVVAVSLNRPPSAALDCLAKFRKGNLTEIAGQPAIELDAKTVASSAGTLLLIGSRKDVEIAIGRVKSGAKAELPAFIKQALSRDPEASFVGAVDNANGQGDQPKNGLITLASTPRHFLLHAEAEMGSDAQAQELTRMLDPKKLEEQGIKLDLGRQRSWVEGRRFFHELTIDGDGTEQARVLGTLAALGIHGVRRYLLRAKEAEAKNTVGHLARELVAYAEAQPPGKPPFPGSAPLTPKNVPRGKKVELPRDAWNHATWKALHFEMPMPVYFSYEIVTSKDGKSATARAIGDLDGDGTFSSYALTVKIDASGKAQISPQMAIENELE